MQNKIHSVFPSGCFSNSSLTKNSSSVFRSVRNFYFNYKNNSSVFPSVSPCETFIQFQKQLLCISLRAKFLFQLQKQLLCISLRVSVRNIYSISKTTPLYFPPCLRAKFISSINNSSPFLSIPKNHL